MSGFLSPTSSHHQHIPLSPSSAAAGDSSSSAISASSRKPRGRPPGSKNRPKPPIVITKDPTSSMHPVFFHVSPSTDVLDSILSFSRRRHLGVSVLSAAGSVANISLRHPAVQNSSFTLNGRFEILSLSGFFLPSSNEEEASPFTITVAGPNGQVIGGILAGDLTAASTVVVTAASFVGPEFYRLPLEKDQEEEAELQEQEEAKPEVGMVLWGSPAAAAAAGVAVPRAPAPHLHRGSHQLPHY